MSDAKEPVEANFKFTGIGNNDGVVYVKADFAKAVVVGNNVGLGFYQLDYSAFANAAAGLAPFKPDTAPVRPVAKIVMDLDGLKMLALELKVLKEKGILTE